MKNKLFEFRKLSEEESVRASFELSESFFNSNLTNASTVKNESSPCTLNKISAENFLSKKRKNSDLNFENFVTFSNSKNSNKKNSPFLSDSKITSYFLHKKNSSNKSEKIKSHESSNEDFSKMNPLEEDNKITCAKKLIFDNVEQSLNNADFSNNFNIQFSQSKDLKIFKNCGYEKNLNLNNVSKEKSFDNEMKLKFLGKNENNIGNINLDRGKNFSEIEKIFERTKNKFSLSEHTLEVIKKLEVQKRFIKNSHSDGTKILKLNLEKLSTSHLDKHKITTSKLHPKDNSPNKNSKSSQSELVRSSQEILSNYSIKEKYEELLKRELILPCHYKILFNKFRKLDETMNYLKRSGSCDTSLKMIEEILYKNFQLDFTIDDFEKILYVTPHFFIYKWDKIFNTKIDFESSSNELFIDVPNDIVRRLHQKYDDKINFTQLQTFPYLPLKFEMSEEILKERASSFKKILLFMTNEHHKKILKDKRIVTKLNPFKHRTWHSEFDIHSAPQLDNFKLIEKPSVFR